MFDGKVGKMDRVERSIEAQVAAFREAIEAASAGPIPEPPARDPLWLRAAQGAGTFAVNLFGLLVLAVMLGGAAAAARLGWELLG